MANVNEAFEIENGLIIDGVALLVGAASPTSGVDAPIGSLYNQNGILWRKTGNNPSDWQTMSSDQRFSRKKIQSSETVTILEDDEMILTTFMNVYGSIDILGEVTIL